MRRFAAFLLVAGLTQIPLWAGDYITNPRALFRSNFAVPVAPSEPPERANSTAKMPGHAQMVEAAISPSHAFMPPKSLFGASAKPAVVQYELAGMNIPAPGSSVAASSHFMPPKSLLSATKLATPHAVATQVSSNHIPPKVRTSGSQTSTVRTTVPQTSASMVAGVQVMPPKTLLGTVVPVSGQSAGQQEFATAPPSLNAQATAPYMPPKSLFSSRSSVTTVPNQPVGAAVAYAPLPGMVSVYAMPALPPLSAPSANAQYQPMILAQAQAPAQPFAPSRTLIQASVPSVARPIETTTPTVPVFPLARLMTPIRQVDYTPHSGYSTSNATAPSAAMPLPTGYMPSGYAGSGPCPMCGAGPRVSGGLLNGRLCAWACYQPTTRGALPIFQPRPYVGPIIAFRCDGSAGCGMSGNCGGGYGAATASGSEHTGKQLGCEATNRTRLLGGDRAAETCRKGGCIPPDDSAFPGYKFAGGGYPTLWTGPTSAQTPVTTTSLKPEAKQPVARASLEAPTKFYKPVYASEANVQPASGNVLSQPFTRP